MKLCSEEIVYERRKINLIELFVLIKVSRIELLKVQDLHIQP